MQNSVKNKVKFGLFITLGVILLIAGVYFIGEKQQLFRTTFRLTAIFADVGGLQPGNNVRFAGINVGTVENITIESGRTVRVGVIVDENVREFIHKNAVASIGSEGLMGNKILIIVPGTAGEPIIENEDRLLTETPLNIDDLIVSFKSTMDNAEMLTRDLAVIVENIKLGKGTIGRLLMDKSWAEDFDIAVVNFKLGSTGLRRLTDEALISFKDNFDSTFVNLKEGSISFKNTVENAEKITFDLSVISDNIRQGNGTLGRLVMDKNWESDFDSTVVNFKQSSLKMSELIEKAKSSWLLWGF
ncbi:MAG: MCE family protein [Ignavibacteriaceae bacterium]|nr:MCE family protein [Ignavibacteriaceae bacterium]